MQLQLHYITQHYATLNKLHYNCNYHYIALHDATLQLQLHYFTLQYIHYTSPCSFRVKVLTGDFVEKRGLQNTNPSRRMAPNALQNTSLGNPKWLPTTKYKTKIIKNHQIRAVYKIDWKKVAPSKARKCPKQALWGMFRLVEQFLAIARVTPTS